jgi:hypothetical protein
MTQAANEAMTLRVFCDHRHMNHRLKAQRQEFEGTYKIRIKCPHCHYEYQSREARWLATTKKLLEAGITSISLRNLTRYG